MPAPMLTAVSWNLCHRPELWRGLPEFGIDIALVQEAYQPPADLRERVEVVFEPWRTDCATLVRNWRAVVARLAPGVDVRSSPAHAIWAPTRNDGLLEALSTDASVAFALDTL